MWAWGTDSQASGTTPVQVTGISAPFIAGVAAGQGFAVVLGSDGSVWGWGDDSAGQLGNAPAPNAVPRPVETIGPGSGITQLSAAVVFEDPKYSHVLALRSDGTVLAWGANTDGELSDGTTASHTGPEQVFGLTGATQVSAGEGFSRCRCWTLGLARR